MQIVWHTAIFQAVRRDEYIVLLQRISEELLKWTIFANKAKHPSS